MKGITEPRLYTPPLRELSADTSLGFACIKYAQAVLKKELYPWQEWALIHMLEIAGDLQTSWRFRYRTVLLLVARQNGKTTLSEVVVSFFLNVLQIESVFGTSLSLEKAEEVWEAVVADQDETPQLKKEIIKRGISRTNGKKRLELRGKRRYKVGAPTRRGGRGDSNDLVLIDEVRELRDWQLWGAAAASTNAKPNGLILGFTNAGDPDSVVLRHIRGKALDRINGTNNALDFGGDIDASTSGLFEWSAPEEAIIDDREAWRQANPALGYGQLTERALVSSLESMPENTFRAECLCQTVETLLPQPFPEGKWAAGVDEKSAIDPAQNLYFGIDMSGDRRWTSIGVCGLREDGLWHIEVVARRIGTEWALDWFRQRVPRGYTRLAFQGRGAPVTGLAEQICTIDGMERLAIEGGELTAGWGRFYDAVKEGKIRHLPQPVLDMPGKTMQLRDLGNGLELPDRMKSPDDISPLYACIMAYAAATRVAPDKKKIYESSYAAGAPIVFV